MNEQNAKKLLDDTFNSDFDLNRYSGLTPEKIKIVDGFNNG